MLPARPGNLAQRLIQAVDSLRDFPERGRPVANELRELPTVPPYIIRNRVEADRVLILRIRHGRQNDALV